MAEFIEVTPTKGYDDYSTGSRWLNIEYIVEFGECKNGNGWIETVDGVMEVLEDKDDIESLIHNTEYGLLSGKFKQTEEEGDTSEGGLPEGTVEV